MLPSTTGKLDGWKAIAEYLGRTERTAQRWVHERGLPVRHLPGGKGSTVFAFQDELDSWLRLDGRRPEPEDARPAGPEAVLPVAAPPDVSLSHQKSSLSRSIVLVSLFTLAATAAGTLAGWSGRWQEAGPIDSVKLDGHALVARDGSGVPLWQVPVESGVHGEMNASPSVHWIDLADLDGDHRDDALVFLHLAQSGARIKQRPTGGAEPATPFESQLVALASDGQRLWSWKPANTLTFGGRRFGVPWRWSASVLVPIGQRVRPYVAMIHEPWWPSFVATIDDAGGSHLRYVQAGHIYTLTVADVSGRPFVLAAGVNNEYAAASLAVLDPLAEAASSPQTPGSPYQCEGCPSGKPVRLVLFPRTEINRASDNPYNRAHEVLVTADGIDVSVFEDGHSRAIYTLSRDFTVQSVTMSDRYWETHRRLEHEGRVNHSVDSCPERRGVEGRVWTPADGWTVVRVPNTASNEPIAAATVLPVPIP